MRDGRTREGSEEGITGPEGSDGTVVSNEKTSDF